MRCGVTLVLNRTNHAKQSHRSEFKMLCGRKTQVVHRSPRLYPRQCAPKVLRLLVPFPSISPQVLGGLYHGASETSLEAKASQDSLAGRWSRRGVICDGRRRRSDCADSKCAVARHRRAFRIRSWRRGNVRRQPGDILCLRQGKRPNTSGWRATCVGLQRLQRLQRLPRRAEAAEAAGADVVRHGELAAGARLSRSPVTLTGAHRYGWVQEGATQPTACCLGA